MGILDRFAKIIPGDDYKKKLFFWNLIQYVLYFILNLLFWNTYTTILYLMQAGDYSFGNLLLFWFYVSFSELLTLDFHVFGDFIWILTNIDLRILSLYLFMPAGIIIDYLWAFKASNKAKYLRISIFSIALLSYLRYTFFEFMDPRYDYFIWYYIINQYGFNIVAIVLALSAILMMWFGVIISNGYLIYKAWKTERER